MATRAGEDSESSDDDVSAPSVGAGAASGGDEALGAALLEALEPPLSSLSGRLVELQEAQRMLVTTLSLQRAEVGDGAPDWLAAKATLDKLPGARARGASDTLPGRASCLARARASVTRRPPPPHHPPHTPSPAFPSQIFSLALRD